MAHYAELDESNVVLRVVVVDNDCEPTEVAGIAWCQDFFGGTWIKTSYNASIRRVFAGIGYTYNTDHDGFIPPSPGEGYAFNYEEWSWTESEE